MPDISPEELKSLQEAKAERDALKKEREDASAAAKAKADEEAKLKAAGDQDLAGKAKAERDAKDAERAKTADLERALKFSMAAPGFLKDNEQYLPKAVADIFTQAEKEQYADSVQKVTAIKEGVVKEFFGIQSNKDLLTPALQSQLDEWLKLTKDRRLEKANQVYENLLEPTLERVKAEKRAAALNKDYGTGGDDAYLRRLKERSEKHYGVKNGA